MDTQTLTAPTPLLDYESQGLKTLVEARQWGSLPMQERIGAVYGFVRNEILFGYNVDDNIPASKVLKDGYGQCNTKGTLLMALMRAVGIPCRLHGFTIKKSLQKGVIPPLFYPIAPNDILHSWVEVFDGTRWVNLEGFILDEAYLTNVQKHFLPKGNTLCGYGVGTDNLAAPQVNWVGEDTYIQRTGINNDFGIFDTPDAFYQQHRQQFSKPKAWLYRVFIRHWMNARAAKIRRGKLL
ncbi:MAG: transglutaminase family protein [Rhodobacteraceae bacterium]|nr:transglutaminase family protein [Paracoccaceae bacterium]